MYFRVKFTVYYINCSLCFFSTVWKCAAGHGKKKRHCKRNVGLTIQRPTGSYVVDVWL